MFKVSCFYQKVHNCFAMPSHYGKFSNSFIYENFENFEPFSKINFCNVVTRTRERIS